MLLLLFCFETILRKVAAGEHPKPYRYSGRAVSDSARRPPRSRSQGKVKLAWGLRASMSPRGTADTERGSGSSEQNSDSCSLCVASKVSEFVN